MSSTNFSPASWAPSAADPNLQIVLNKLYASIAEGAQHFLGYPCNLNFDYRPLYRFMDYSINNLGDPFLPSNIKLNTHSIECDLIRQFAALTHADPAQVWGYVTNGGTEGNMYGFYLARELYPRGLVYCSEDTHYSVAKILRLLKCRSIMIKSQANGEMDYDDLYETMRIHRDVPPIVIANIGTTMKGAVDSLGTINSLIRELALPAHYLHADAALSGMILPYLQDAPLFGFDGDIDSISISGHKMIGSPFPCGVVLAKKANVERIARSIEYIGTLDTTLSGSRNGLSPLFLWYALRTRGEEGFRKIIASCFETADYAIERFAAIGVHAWRHSYSNTVVIPRPSKSLICRWQLAAQGTIAHIITMPHVSRERIDQFIVEWVASRDQTEI